MSRIDKLGQVDHILPIKHVFSVYDAKTNFSKLLRIVKANHEVIITDRGQPVARLVAETSAALSEDPLEARLDELEASGRLIPAKKSAANWKHLPRGKSPGALRRFFEER